MNDTELYTSHITLGLIVNPLAGIGGPAGLKGSDDAKQVAQALADGAERRAAGRAGRCLAMLYRQCLQRVSIITCLGVMGEYEARAAGFEPELIAGLDLPAGQHENGSREVFTSADHTRVAAARLQQAGVDLLLFVGGDGTARDVCSVVGEHLPVLGIPSGVKMHSGVFAISPEAAAEVVMAMIAAELVDLRLQEVRDIDEMAFRQGMVKSRYYGEMIVPQVGHFVQASKDGGREVEALVLDDIAAEVHEQLQPDTLYLVGAGTTPRALMEALELPNSLLGIDAVCNEKLVAADLSGPQLEFLLEAHSGEVVAILSITGGQGSLIGRGNQQLTPRVLRRLGRDNLWVLATKTKIRELQGRPLLMDSNDLELDRQWSGYIPVITGYRDHILYPLGAYVEETAEAHFDREAEAHCNQQKDLSKGGGRNECID